MKKTSYREGVVEVPWDSSSSGSTEGRGASENLRGRVDGDPGENREGKTGDWERKEGEGGAFVLNAGDRGMRTGDDINS